jgi:hypothetical protein
MKRSLRVRRKEIGAHAQSRIPTESIQKVYTKHKKNQLERNPVLALDLISVHPFFPAASGKNSSKKWIQRLLVKRIQLCLR